jgi:hypothetical protein
VSTTVLLSGAFIVMITAVFAPGAGVTVPLIMICWAAMYEAASVWTVTVYGVAARAGVTRKARARGINSTNDELRSAFLDGTSLLEQGTNSM